MAKDVTLTIDGTQVTVPEGTLIVEAAKQIELEIPVYCYHPKMGPAGLCRICLVDVEKMGKLQIACNTTVAEGMVVNTMNERSMDGRRAVLEFLLKNHPLDCPICDKGGECDLQDYSMAFGQGFSRLADPKEKKPKAVELGPTIVLDEERCIVCQRCVRFDQIITQESVLRTEDRGAHTIIATATGEPYKTDFTGNVTELCPVGALTSRTYRFKSRPWDNHRTRTSCTQCSVGCQMNLDQRLEIPLRTMSVPEDDPISDGWLCDRGRYNIGFYKSDDRITSPLFRSGDEWMQIGWDDALAMWATAIKDAIAAQGVDAVAALGGGRLLNEEAYLLATTHRALGIENLDWRTGRQRTASPGPFGGTFVDLENAQAIVVVGRPPSQIAPVMDLRIRKAVARNGAALISAGSYAARSFVDERHVATLEEARSALPGVERIAFVWDGIDPLGTGLDAWMQALRGAGKTVYGFIPGETPNARGAAAMGMTPTSAQRNTRTILEGMRDGKVRVLSVFGANPMLHYPDSALLEAAFEKTGADKPFVVVSDLFFTQTAAHASLVLPAKGAHEKDGTFTNAIGDVVDVMAGLRAPEGTLSDLEILVGLADTLGVTLPTPETIIAAARELAREADVSTFGDLAAFEQQSHPSAGEGLRLAVGTAIFAGGGTVVHDQRIADLRARPTATFDEATAAAHGLEPGDRIDLHSGKALLKDLEVVLDKQALPNVIGIVDGLPSARANDVVTGAPADIAAVRKARVPVGAA